MSSVFFEIKENHFIRSELIKAFFKETVIIAASFSNVQYEEKFCFVIEGEDEPLITTEECYNSYIELLRGNDKLKRSY